MGELLMEAIMTKQQVNHIEALKRKKKMKKVRRVFLYVVLIVVGLSMMLPFFWMLSAALKYEKDVFSIPIQWIPRDIRWSNYSRIWTEVPFLTYYKNTVVVAVSVTILQILTCSLAAYSFSKIKYFGRDFLFLGYLSTLMIPFTVIMIPQFIIIQKLGLMDSLQALILLGAFSPFGVFLFRQFFLSIPEELSESARIDGCSELRIYAKIIMPNSKPAIGSLVIFTFVFHWNDFLGPLIYLTSTENKTLQVGMRAFQTEYAQNYALLMAAAVCAMLPTIVAYLLAQDLFVKGVAATGIKG